MALQVYSRLADGSASAGQRPIKALERVTT